MSTDRLDSAVIQGARRIVIKVGSTLVTDEGRGVDAQAIGNWCAQMAALAREDAPPEAATRLAALDAPAAVATRPDPAASR